MGRIADNLRRIREDIAETCSRSGRAPDDVTLIAVSKTFPLESILEAHNAGQLDFGENKAQELSRKVSGYPAASGARPRWHMIGHLQRNKAGLVAQHADVFHALDGLKLARALNRKCAEAQRVLECFVQVNVSGEASKFGLDPAELYPFLGALAECPGLRVKGLMTLAADTDDPESVRPQFQLLRKLAAGFPGADHVSLDNLSMGMSGDYRIAIEEGATHVRIGSAIFGHRSYE